LYLDLGKTRKYKKLFIIKPHGMLSFGRHRYAWEDNVKVDLGEN
jgi:hypothetical protein